MNPRILIICLAFLAASCSSEDTVPIVPPRYPLHIDYQAGFQGDSVVVAIDGKVLSSGIFTSDTMGFAGRDLLSLLASSHTLSVYAFSGHIKNRFDTTFVQPAASFYLGVGYSVTSQWLIRFSNSPFVYQPTY